MKYFFSAILLLAGFAAKAQLSANENSKQVMWKENHKLTWDLYKGMPDRSNEADAITTYTISLVPAFAENGDVILHVYNNFQVHDSWVKHECDNLLKHEQGHFDLAEVYVRWLRKELSKLNYSQNLNKQISFLYNTAFDALVKEQDVYDRESDFSRNKQVQREWEKHIEDQLNEYKDYTDPVVVIKKN